MMRPEVSWKRVRPSTFSSERVPRDRSNAGVRTDAMMSAAMELSPAVDADVVAGRLRLLAWTQGDNRLSYLAILRAFDRAHRRADRPQGLHTDDVAAELAAMGEAQPADLEGSLDQLTTWAVLAKAYDTASVRTIADYRRRRSLYALTELGYLSFRVVEDLVAAAPSGSERKILALGSLHNQLLALAEAAHARHAVAVVQGLDQLHLGIADLAERAERFYRRLADLGQHVRRRSRRLPRGKGPPLPAPHRLRRRSPGTAHASPVAVGAVRAAASDELIVDLACEADKAVHLTPAERRARWADAWAGISGWFVDAPAGPSAASLLEQRTITAIAETTTLLRRLVARRGSTRGRQAQLRHLAAWVAACESDADASALVGAALGLRRPRRLGLLPSDIDTVRPSTSWSTAPPVAATATFRNQGHVTSPGKPQPVRLEPLAPPAPRRRATEATGRRAASPRRPGEHHRRPPTRPHPARRAPPAPRPRSVLRVPS